MKKYISPGSWFSLEYPTNWNEFEDEEDTFLFYNPNKWNGNFRISATKGKDNRYGDECLRSELRENPFAVITVIGKVQCAFSSESFRENGNVYTSYIWIMDYGTICINCSFTTTKNGEKSIAEDIIHTIYVPKLHSGFHQELIPIRILEVGEINAAYGWVEKIIKKELKTDFTGEEDDIAKLQQVIDSGKFKPQQKEIWSDFALTFGSIIVNEMEGMEWKTFVDGSIECPVLQFMNSNLIINPIDLIYNKVKQNEQIDLIAEYEKIQNAAVKMIKLKKK
ncbi:DUF3805 domain-containing protein [Phocaeicola oris]|uniref:DUF3805 domain-containing protein n=1 Tax=Phocaeicola oris TaxID=2896850 RepID=UPI00234F169E|nr:DUF3805 domain-containing protein [Phocaeicola oris]MCE2615481.1 DUF3805 domain-containing protein [Phocaeicola oris]